MNYFENLLCARAHGLRLPTEIREDVDRYVQSQRAGADPEHTPFPRRLDLWAYSAFAALALGLEPVDEARVARTCYRFKDTRTVNMSPELCELLAIVSAAGLGPEDDRLTQPAEIIKYANRLAAAGAPVVIDKLKDVDLRLTPLEKMVRHAESLLDRVGEQALEAARLART